MDNENNLWNVFNSINEWIKFSDTKSSVVLASNGIILSIIFANISQILTLIQIKYFTFLILLSFFLGVSFSLLAVLFSVLCLSPQTKNKKKDGLIYFKHIANNFKTEEEYSKSMQTALKNDKFEKQVYEQIFQNSKVASNKFSKVKWAIRLMGISLFFLIIPTLYIFFPF